MPDFAQITQTIRLLHLSDRNINCIESHKLASAFSAGPNGPPDWLVGKLALWRVTTTTTTMSQNDDEADGDNEEEAFSAVPHAP